MNVRVKVTVSKSFVVWRDPAVYASFPSLCDVGDGVLLSFRVAPAEPIVTKGLNDGLHQQHLHPRSFLAITRLTKRFRSEELILFPSDLFASDQDPNLFMTSAGRILMSSFSWRPVVSPDRDAVISTVSEPTSSLSAVFWGGFTSLSSDGGRTWRTRNYLPPIPGYPDVVEGVRAQMGGRIRGQVIEADGKLILPVYNCPTPNSNQFSSHQFLSRDDGEQWEYAGVIAQYNGSGVGYCEPTLYKMASGEVVAFHRTFGASGRLAISRSCDGCQTWSAPVLTDVIGHPFYALNFQPGYVLLLYGVRNAPFSIRARVIREKDLSFIGPEITIRDNGRARDIGYPSAVLIDDNHILIVYYWIDKNQTRYISGNTIDIKLD